MSTPTVIDGKLVAESIYSDLKKQLNQPKAKQPHLVAVLVGNNSASQTYVNAKINACKRIGLKSSLIKLAEATSQNQLLEHIDKLNKDNEVDGYIVQLPLPKHIDEFKVTLAIDPRKDVDGFHPYNLGRLMLNQPTFLPATPSGIIDLLAYYKINPSGKHCVIIGRSNIVGTPLSIMLSRNKRFANATTTLVHSKSEGVKELLLTADIILVAVGKPLFLKEEMVKQGAVVIDVGIHSIEDKSKAKGYRLVGDVDYEKVAKKCSYISKVPGGVGPMTIASLIKNTVKATLSLP